jgi:putative ubiquitin-RnfH superfamily antitoxin RatB of RatAB toxin-antitoxin module
MTKKVVKGSVIADHLADHAIEDYESLNFDFPDEDVLAIEEEKLDWWIMYFDGAVNVCGNGVGAVIISPDKKQYLVLVKLQFGCTNNTAEYEACILGLEVALEMNIRKIDVYGDSMLIICQVKGEFEEIEFTHLGTLAKKGIWHHPKKATSGSLQLQI